MRYILMYVFMIWTLLFNISNHVSVHPQKDAPQQVTTSVPVSTKSSDEVEIISIGENDTIMSVLTSRGIYREVAHDAIEELYKTYTQKTLKTGQTINLKYTRTNGSNPARLRSIDFIVDTNDDKLLKYTLSEYNGKFITEKIETQLTRARRRVRGQIDLSFYSAALKRGVPAQIVREAIVALGRQGINWQDDPTKGDEFEIIFDIYVDKEGNTIKAGNLQCINFKGIFGALK